jgi:hypothetical protein
MMNGTHKNSQMINPEIFMRSSFSAHSPDGCRRSSWPPRGYHGCVTSEVTIQLKLFRPAAL